MKSFFQRFCEILNPFVCWCLIDPFKKKFPKGNSYKYGRFEGIYFIGIIAKLSAAEKYFKFSSYTREIKMLGAEKKTQDALKLIYKGLKKVLIDSESYNFFF